MRRAAHQLYDQPLIFSDPLAFAILGEDAAEQIRSMAERENQIPWALGLRAFVAARSRFAEEELARAVDQSLTQYVVLGAGLDTFACRNPFPELQVFEVDFPETQAWKRARLNAAAIPVPESAHFVAVDFERHSLAERLASAGFRADQPSFFSWLGVVPYLTSEAAFTTLRFIATLPRGSGVVFDYAIRRELMSDAERAMFDQLAERVARVGEPFRLAFAPDELQAELRTLGFRTIEDLNIEALRARWFPNQENRFHGRSGRLLCAWL